MFQNDLPLVLGLVQHQLWFGAKLNTCIQKKEKSGSL